MPQWLISLAQIATHIERYGYWESDPPPGVARAWLIKRPDDTGYQYVDTMVGDEGPELTDPGGTMTVMSGRHYSELKRIPITEWTDDELAKQLIDLSNRVAIARTRGNTSGAANSMQSAKKVAVEVKRRMHV